MKDKWKMFKNFLHNELEITREDIREWITEACIDEARRLVDQEFKEFNVKTMIRREIEGNQFWDGKLRSEIKTQMAIQLVEKVELKINA